jgi:hypothetical protein
MEICKCGEEFSECTCYTCCECGKDYALCECFFEEYFNSFEEKDDEKES